MSHLTLLQRAVISRLRKAGHPTIADDAQLHWRAGSRVEADAVMDIRGEELKRDFEKANRQVDSGA